MAVEIGTTVNAVNVMSAVFDIGSTVPQLSRMISFAGALGPAFPLIGTALALVHGFLPDDNHDEIIRRFDQLNNKIDQVRNDLEVVGKDIKGEILENTYLEKVRSLELATQFCFEIGKANDTKTRNMHQGRLKEYCFGHKCTESLNFILRGMIGDYVFKGIFDKLYDQTDANRSRISAVGLRLLQVVCGGMMVVITYDTMQHGTKAAEDLSSSLYSLLNASALKIQSVRDRCVEKYKANMLNDLNRKLDAGGSNAQLADELSRSISVKYDWLENFVLFYDDMWGPDKHEVKGEHVANYHRNGRCGVVFYRRKDEKPKFSNRYDEAYRIVVDTSIAGVFSPYRADDCYEKISNVLKVKGIAWTGFVVICPTNADVQYRHTFSAKIIDVKKTYKQLRAGSGFSSGIAVGSRVILLLK